MRLLVAASVEQWDAARRLVSEYAASLGIDLSFQDFDRELASLSEEYGPPRGEFILAEQEGVFLGCGGFHPSPGAGSAGGLAVCEMKRLYVAPAGRGFGIGRAIAMRLIADARARGYAAMRLDTLPAMTAARQIYATLGFREIEPYRYNPVEGTTFLELTL